MLFSLPFIRGLLLSSLFNGLFLRSTIHESIFSRLKTAENPVPFHQPSPKQKSPQYNPPIVKALTTLLLTLSTNRQSTYHIIAHIIHQSSKHLHIAHLLTNLPSDEKTQLNHRHFVPTLHKLNTHHSDLNSSLREYHHHYSDFLVYCQPKSTYPQI
jgi:hypothetical protein